MQKFQQQYLILSADTYSIRDEETKELNEGISIWYIPDNDIQPSVNPSSSRGQASMGIKPVKMSLPLELVGKLQSVPGIYNVTLRMTAVLMKQQIRPVDIDFVSSVKLVMEKPK